MGGSRGNIATMSGIASDCLNRSLCGLANLGIVGNLYVGVDASGRVKGVPITKQQVCISMLK